MQNLIPNQGQNRNKSVAKSVQICLKIVPESIFSPRAHGVTPPSGAVLAKISKNGHAHLPPGGLLGAKLAALGAQDGATDGQVGGTWDPKWGQHGENHRSEDGSFFWYL